MSWYEELDRWTADYLPDMIYEHDAALAKYTSFRIGGPDRIYSYATTHMTYGWLRFITK